MSSTSFLRPLVAFDPKKNLLVNETFRLTGGGQIDADPLASLAESEKEEQKDPEAGNEKFRLRLSAGILSGIRFMGEKESNPYFFAIHRNGGASVFHLESDKAVIDFSKDFSGSVIRTPGLSKGLIHIITREGVLIGLKIDDILEKGEINPIWQKRLKKGSLSEVAVAGNNLVVACLDGLHAFDAYYDPKDAIVGGREMWFFPLQGIASSPIVEGGNIYLGTEEKIFYALEHGSNSAAVRWKFAANAAIRMKAGISLKYDYVLFGAMDGSLYCLDRYEGNQRWYAFLNAPIYSGVATMEKENTEYYYLGADNGYFYCFDTFGKKVWNYRTGGKIRSEPFVHEEVVYFGSGDNYLYALDANTGKLVFRFSAGGDIIGCPIVYKNRLMFSSEDNFIYGVKK